jgi:hypothetical protein
VAERDRVSLKEEIATTEQEKEMASLRDPWQAKKHRFQIAGGLAIGLLVLFGLTIVCSGLIVTTLIVASATSGALAADPNGGVDQIVNFITTVLPYIATPLGVALGFYFKDSRAE